MNNFDKEIGTSVKSLVAKRGVLHKDIAAQLGIKKASLSQMLSGIVPLPYDRCVQILDFLSANECESAPINELYAKKTFYHSGERVPLDRCREITNDLYFKEKANLQNSQPGPSDVLWNELAAIWPKLAVSERAKVLAFAAEQLEKQGGTAQPPVLDKQELA